MKIKDLLQNKAKLLGDISHSPRLDIELLLCKALAKNRAFLYANLDNELDQAQRKQFDRLLAKRLQGVPMAYILGKQAFWDMELKVDENVLIPRPETECLVEKLLQLLPHDKSLKLADLGTGSGAIALAIAKTCPKWALYATDISEHCLKIAKFNAQNYQINNIQFFQGNWFQALPDIKFDCIISNPPYIAEGDKDLEHHVEKHEPNLALKSQEDGLACIKTIISQAKPYLVPMGYLILEHGYCQEKQVHDLFQKHGFESIHAHKDYSGHVRFTVGQKLSES